MKRPIIKIIWTRVCFFNALANLIYILSWSFILFSIFRTVLILFISVVSLSTTSLVMIWMRIRLWGIFIKSLLRSSVVWLIFILVFVFAEVLLFDYAHQVSPTVAAELLLFDVRRVMSVTRSHISLLLKRAEVLHIIWLFICVRVTPLWEV